jgi:hypothetical protein
MLRPAGEGFARVAVASTLCPGCAQRVEHPVKYTIRSTQTSTTDGIRTRMIANDTLVIHACVGTRPTEPMETVTD